MDVVKKVKGVTKWRWMRLRGDKCGQVRMNFVNLSMGVAKQVWMLIDVGWVGLNR
jgi:hypothetical protein